MMKRDGVRYLILGISLPCVTRPPASHEESVRKAGKKLGCAISSVYLFGEDRVPQSGERTWSDGRYMLAFPGGAADDQRASKITDALSLSYTLLMGPVVPLEDLAWIYRFPADMVREDGYLSIDALMAYDERLPLEERFPFPGLRPALYRSIGAGEDQMMRVWELIPVVIEEPIFSAVRNLSASFREFYVFPGGVPEVLARPHETPEGAYDQSRAENAIINAFKAVEALIGDLPRDERKYFAKLKSVGVDPFRDVGYKTYLPLHQRIRELNRVRDRKAAHGGTGTRPLTYYDLMDLQLCARLVVITALEQKLGHSIFD